MPTPTAGILIEPNDSIRIGLSWRREAKLYYTQPTNIDLGDIGNLNLDVTGLARYWPDVFSAGLSVKPTSRWLISAQVNYLRWSQSPNDQASVKVTPSKGIIDGLGLGSILGFTSQDARCCAISTSSRATDCASAILSLRERSPGGGAAPSAAG